MVGKIRVCLSLSTKAPLDRLYDSWNPLVEKNRVWFHEKETSKQNNPETAQKDKNYIIKKTMVSSRVVCEAS